MNLNEEIKRIKSLMLENSDPYTILTQGNVNDVPGIHISIGDGETKMGHSNLLNFNDSSEWDPDILRLLGDNGMFNNDNSIYLYDLEVYEPHRGKGLSNQLMDTCHNLGKDMGIEYITLITGRNNNVAQNLYRKYGYDVFNSNDYKDFFYKRL